MADNSNMLAVFKDPKAPLTRDNVTGWARAKFGPAFAALPASNELDWMNLNRKYDGYDRTVQRYLSRSAHSHLLVVGAFSPGHELTEEVICAHIHEDDTNVTFFHVKKLDQEVKYSLKITKDVESIAFNHPFSDAGKELQHVQVLIMYYFLEAGYLKELVRYVEGHETAFTKRFEEACKSVEKGEEQDAASQSPIAVTSAPIVKHREAETGSKKEKKKSAAKRPALRATARTSVANSSTNSSVEQDQNQPGGVASDETEISALQKQIKDLAKENDNLGVELAEKRCAFRYLYNEHQQCKKDNGKARVKEEEGEVETLQAELRVWKARAEKAEAEVKDTRRELQNLRAAIRNLVGGSDDDRI